MIPFRPLSEFWPKGGAPVARCPNYALCGDYATRARPGSRPGRVEVACAYCARRIEEREARAEEVGR